MALVPLLLVACQLSTRAVPPVIISSGEPELTPMAGQPQKAATYPAILTITPLEIVPEPSPSPLASIPPTLQETQPSPPASATAPNPTSTLSAVSSKPPLTTLLFTGVIVPARCVQAAIDARGEADYIYAEVRDLIQAADLSIGTYNAAMSDYPPHTGCVRTYVLVGSPNNADAMANAGFDVMSVATNHIKNCGQANCGDIAFFDTLANLRRVGILPVGAGVNHAEAMQPVVVSVNGVRFGIVSLGQIEPLAFAGEDTPGIAILNSVNLQAAISAARLVSDVVIAMPHWGPEDVSWPTYIQRDLAHQLVEAGADLVVGNHTHVVQAIQDINGVLVFYGLGNFVFDQDLRDHQQGVILQVQFRGTELAGYHLVPTHVDQDGTVHLAGAKEAVEILARVEEAGKDLR